VWKSGWYIGNKIHKIRMPNVVPVKPRIVVEHDAGGTIKGSICTFSRKELDEVFAVLDPYSRGQQNNMSKATSVDRLPYQLKDTDLFVYESAGKAPRKVAKRGRQKTMKVAELRAALTRKGLSPVGLKQVLQARLAEAEAEAEAEAGSAGGRGSGNTE
jgi:hypothetical protein